MLDLSVARLLFMSSGIECAPFPVRIDERPRLQQRSFSPFPSLSPTSCLLAMKRPRLHCCSAWPQNPHRGPHTEPAKPPRYPKSRSNWPPITRPA